MFVEELLKVFVIIIMEKIGNELNDLNREE